MAYSLVFLYQIAIAVFFKLIDCRSSSIVMDILYLFLPAHVSESLGGDLAESKIMGLR